MADHPISFRKSLQWKAECLGHLVLESIIGRLPATWAFRLGECLGGMLWHLMPSRQSTILRNLRIALAGTEAPEEIERMAKASFRRTCGNLISAAHTSPLPPEKLREALHVENQELLEQSLASGQGVVLLLSHMGNWELLSRLIHLLPPGTHAGAFYRPLNNPWLNQRVLDRRQADGTRMFSKRDPFHQICRFLRDGGVVGILADQRAGLHGELASFFDRATRCSPLPSLLARRTRCHVIALSLTTDSPGRWRACFLPVNGPATTQACMSTLQAAMARSPLDVFWLQERWRTYIRPHEGITDWLAGLESRSPKPHRFVFWPDTPPAEWYLPAHWIHPDMDYELILDASANPPSGLPSEPILHRPPEAREVDDLMKFVQQIDRSRPLPIDMVIASTPCPSLTRACRRLGIPVLYPTHDHPLVLRQAEPLPATQPE